MGGESYRMEVRAVTEAGLGDPTAISDTPLVRMPILGVCVHILLEHVVQHRLVRPCRSRFLQVRYRPRLS